MEGTEQRAALPEEIKDGSTDIEAGGSKLVHDSRTAEGLSTPPSKIMGYSTITEEYDIPYSYRMGLLPVPRLIPSFPETTYLRAKKPGDPEGANTIQGYSGIEASNGSKGNGQLGAASKYLQKQLLSLEGAMVEKASGWKSKIQKVHPRLRKKQDFEKYYNPMVLAFGPIHHKDNELKEAEKLKLSLASHFIKGNDVNKEELCSNILMKIEDLKECYATDLLNDYTDDELTWMFLVDGCAVLCFIQCLVAGGEDGEKVFFSYDELETLQIKIDKIPFILRDLFLLENQLPFPLLLLISSFVSDGEKLIYSIKLLVAERAGADSPPSQEHVKEEPNYLLDLLREFLTVEPEKLHGKSPSPAGVKTWPNFTSPRGRRSWEVPTPLTEHVPYSASVPALVKPSSDKEKPDKKVGENKKKARYSDQYTFRHVTELKASGVGFKRSETNSLKAITFHPGWFLGDVKLPLLRISDDSAPIFLNLVACEMCPDFKNDYEVTSYICFLDSLIDQPEDVAELRKANILQNLFGSDEEVAKLFNEIGTDLVPNPTIYSDVKQQIDGVYRSKWKVLLAEFLDEHFSSPWSVLAFVGATFALALTLVQTWYAINSKQ